MTPQDNAEPIKIVRCSGSTKENPHRQHASPMLSCMVLDLSPPQYPKIIWLEPNNGGEK